MQQITITQGDFGIVFNITLKDNTGTPIDLIDCAVSVDIVKPDLTKNTKTVIIKDVPNGKVQYILDDTDTDLTGVYTMYFIITATGYKITTQTTMSYYVISKDGGVN